MELPTLKELVSDSKKAIFHHYKEGKLYYRITIVTEITSDTYEFPIDITNTEDIGTATLLNEDKAIIFMRYIRKALANNEVRFIPSVTLD